MTYILKSDAGGAEYNAHIEGYETRLEKLVEMDGSRADEAQRGSESEIEIEVYMTEDEPATLQD